MIPGTELDAWGVAPSIPPIGAAPTAASGTTDPATKAAYADYEGAEKQLEDFQGKPPQFKFDEQAPQNQQAGVMARAPLLLALTAIGGKAFKLHGKAMLGATNGMVKGLIQGSDKAYQDAEKQYEDHYKQAMQKYQTELQLYNHGLEMYKGRVDQKLKALEFARQVNKDNQQVTWDDFNKWIMTGKYMDELERTQIMRDKADHAGTGAGGAQLTDKAAQIRAAMATMGVSMPTGSRSEKGQVVTLNAIAEKYPDKSPDEIAEMIRSGQVDMKVTGAEAQILGRREGSLAAGLAALTKQGGIFDQLDAAAKKINFGDNKVLSSLKLAAQGKAVADKDIQAYRNLIEDARSEMVTILSRAGVPSDAVRKSAAEMFPLSSSYSELTKSISTSKQVAKAVLDGNSMVIDAIKSGKPLAEVLGLAGGGRTVVRTGVSASTGQKFVQYSDGTIEPAK